MLVFADICAGISAATVAWAPLGWTAAFYSEIDKFPSAVLAHHYPATPNFGDLRKFDEWPDAALDVLCAGTPCQGFSLAGLRKGLDDPRSNLALVFGLVARRYRPRWLVWENVPGVRSLNCGRDFAAFLSGLVECGYGLAWRSLDAQHAGLAQRRERVFLVAHLGDWRRAAAVLFEPAGLRWDPSPRRAAEQGIAGTLAGGARGSGGYSHDDIPLVSGTITGSYGDRSAPEAERATLLAFGGNNTAGEIDVATACNAHAGRLDFETETLIVEDAPLAFDCRAGGLTGMSVDELPGALHNGEGGGRAAVAFQPRYARNDRGAPQDELAYPLTAEAGRTGKGDSAQAVAYRVHGANSNAMRGNGVAHVADEADVSRALDTKGGYSQNQGGNVIVGTLAPNAGPRSHDAGNFCSNQAVDAGYIVPCGWAVRRLTPTECERLMGLPDGYTAIPWRGRPASRCPDGPRYKALGNSIAVPDLAWIGRRIALCDSIP